jgi:hypothetical protein
LGQGSIVLWPFFWLASAGGVAPSRAISEASKSGRPPLEEREPLEFPPSRREATPGREREGRLATVVAVPILLGVPTAFLRVVPRVMPCPAAVAFGGQVFAGAAGLRTPFTVAGKGAAQLVFGLLDLVLTLGAVLVGSRKRRTGHRKDNAENRAGHGGLSVLLHCFQGCLLERIGGSMVGQIKYSHLRSTGPYDSRLWA